jgi:hypothetical protein
LAPVRKVLVMSRWSKFKKIVISVGVVAAGGFTVASIPEIRKFMMTRGIDSDPSRVGISVTRQGNERTFKRSG